MRWGVRAVTGTRASVLVLALLALGPWRATGPASEAVVVRPGVAVYGATPGERGLVAWAVGRYEGAALHLPPLEIHFHADPSGCRGYHAFYSGGGRIDMCPGRLLNLVSRKNLLHEMAHAWAERNLDTTEREAFLELRGLGSWNDREVDWRLRGSEQAAEIIAWELGDRVLSPSIPDNGTEEVEAAFTLLAAGGLPTEVALGPTLGRARGSSARSSARRV